MKNNKAPVLFSGIAPAAFDLSTNIQSIHSHIAAVYSSIDRMAIAIYDASADSLKTFVSSNSDGELLQRYEAKLQEVASLSDLVKNRQSRLVSDIAEVFSSHSPHTRWLMERGYRSSYTVPIYQGANFVAFVFFDSKLPDAFDERMARFLDVFANLACQLYLLDLRLVQSIVGVTHITSSLARVRDLETGQHLLRMASYSQLMARAVADKHRLTDEFVEYVHLFSPLHDVGKVGIPDKILLKPGKLDVEEWETMRRHVEIGESIIDGIVADMALDETLATRIMRNIVAYHHERGDGKGYPHGLAMHEIPIEGRIVAVADVYDALSSRRPYKEPWPESEVITEIQREVDAGRLDGDCVAALLAAKNECAEIKIRFADRELHAQGQ